MRTIAILQARMGSSRLPGKMLMPLAGREILHRVIDRVSMARTPAEVVVATAESPANDAIADCCQAWGVPCFRGSELDVLERFRAAAELFRAELIVRINADNPLIDPHYIDELVHHHQGAGADYCTYRMGDGRPVMLAGISFFAETIVRHCLDRAAVEITDPYEREHVTLGIYKRPERFTVDYLRVPQDCDEPSLRLTMDTDEDIALAEEIFAALNGRAATAGAGEVVALVRSRPDWLARMAAAGEQNPKLPSNPSPDSGMA